MISSVISPDQQLLIWAVILSGVALTMWLERRYRWAGWIGGPTLGLLLGMFLSNTGVLPNIAETYDLGSTLILPLAIPLLLFRASLIRILQDARLMLLPFVLCCIGTVVGGCIAFLVLRSMLPHAAEIVGVEVASNIGGSVNFGATREALHIDDGTASSLLLVDNLIMVSAFIFLFRLAASKVSSKSNDPPENVAAAFDQNTPFDSSIRLRSLATALSIAIALAAGAELLSTVVHAGVDKVTPEFLASANLGAVLGNKYVLVSILSLLVATCFQSMLSRLDGTQDLGLYLLYVYLFTMGLPANIMQVAGDAPLLAAVCAIVTASNVSVALIIGRLARLPFEPLLLTINATVGGPSTAAAMAGSCRWHHLVVPSILAGLLGYAVATVIGIVVARWLMALQ